MAPASRITLWRLGSNLRSCRATLSPTCPRVCEAAESGRRWTGLRTKKTLQLCELKSLFCRDGRIDLQRAFGALPVCLGGHHGARIADHTCAPRLEPAVLVSAYGIHVPSLRETTESGRHDSAKTKTALQSILESRVGTAGFEPATP